MFFLLGLQHYTSMDPTCARGSPAKCQARIASSMRGRSGRISTSSAQMGISSCSSSVGGTGAFDLPSKFYRLRISPRDVLLSTPWPTPIARFSTPEAFSCCRLEELSEDFLEAHGKIWQRVLAHLVLSRREREVWQSLKGPEKRKTEWLLGRVAAKDAIRLFLKEHYGMELYPADIEIAQDRYGQPLVRGAWTEELEHVPVISLSHSDGIAVAVAGDDGQCRGIGVDIEPLDQ